jgi:hypothetical protein
MKKITFTLLLITGLSNYNYGQVSSNPGTWDWSNPLGWSGGSVPTSTQVVNIGTNSSVTVDFPLTHDATINLIGGSLQSVIPTNSLTINGGDLNITNFSSSLNFLGSGGTPTPVNINDGHLSNAGLFLSGDLTIDFNLTSGNSVNNGDFMIQGDFTIIGNEIFDNNLGMNVSGQVLLEVSCTWNNNSNANVGSIVNDGDIVNVSDISTTDSLYNSVSGTILSSMSTVSAGTDVINYGSYTISDSLSVGNDFMNYGTFVNNQGGVSIANDFYNYASISGSLNGKFDIANYSLNDLAGALIGDIDICDATLAVGDHLDDDFGYMNNDFNTVVFCTVSFASIDENENLVVSVFPNPTNDQLNIQSDVSFTAELTDLNGAVIYRITDESTSHTLNLSDLENGVYFLKTATNDANGVQQIVKM